MQAVRIGISDAESEGAWIDANTKQDISYSHWDSGEGEANFGDNKAHEDYGIVHHGKSDDGYWFDVG